MCGIVSVLDMQGRVVNPAWIESMPDTRLCAVSGTVKTGYQ